MAATITLNKSPLWAKMRARNALLLFSFEVTARCNNNCRHCYINLPASDQRARANEITLEEIDRITSEAVELGAVWCTLTGGEPLLRKDFADIYLLLKRKGLLVGLYTNATLITPAHVELFKKYPLRNLEVTVYGVTAATYEAVTRVPGSFAAFKRGLDLLLAGGIPVRLKAMTLRSNLHEHAAIASFCREHTKDYYRFDPVLNLRIDGDSKRNQEIISERLTAEEIVQIEREDGQRFQELQRNCSYYLSPDPIHLDCDHLFHCSAGMESFELSHDGKFRLCSSLVAPGAAFDLRKGTLREAWTQFVPRVREMRAQHADFFKCRDCSIKNLCSRCPATAFIEHGEFDRVVEYFCQVAHARAESLKEHTGFSTEAGFPPE